jgi:hypothetical protein
MKDSQFEIFEESVNKGLKPNTDHVLIWQWIKEGRIDYRMFVKYMQAS